MEEARFSTLLAMVTLTNDEDSAPSVPDHVPEWGDEDSGHSDADLLTAFDEAVREEEEEEEGKDDPFGDEDDSTVLLAASMPQPTPHTFSVMAPVDPCPPAWSPQGKMVWAEFSDIIGWHPTWPVYFTDLFMKPPKYQNRIAIMCFSWLNGIDPDHVIQWFYDAGVLTPKRNKHFESIQQALHSGRYAKKWYSYCVHTRRYEFMNGQSVSADLLYKSNK